MKFILPKMTGRIEQALINNIMFINARLVNNMHAGTHVYMHAAVFVRCSYVAVKRKPEL